MSSNGAEPPSDDDIEEALANTDWDKELAGYVDTESASMGAMKLTNHWMNSPAFHQGNEMSVSNGDVVTTIYIKALAKAVGYSDPHQLAEDNPELAGLYDEIIQGLIAQGMLIHQGINQVIATEHIMRYVGAWSDDDGE